MSNFFTKKYIGLPSDTDYELMRYTALSYEYVEHVPIQLEKNAERKNILLIIFRFVLHLIRIVQNFDT